MAQRRESLANNANGNEGNPFFFTAVWDEGGATQVALLNRSDDLETARQVLTKFSPFLKSRRIMFEIDVPNRGGGSRRAGIPPESWSIVTKSCSEVFLRLSPLGQVEQTTTSRYTGGADPVNHAHRQRRGKVGTTGVTRSPKMESRTPENRNRGRNARPDEKKGGSTGWKPMSTRANQRASRRSSFCRQCIERGVSCTSSGRSALICIQCVEERLPCSLKPADPIEMKKRPSRPQFRRPPSPNGFSSSSLTELGDESEKDGSVFSISNETDVSDDLDYVSGTEELELWEEDDERTVERLL